MVKSAHEDCSTYARWHLKRGEGDETKAWERDRRLLGTHVHKTRPEAPPKQVRSSRHTHKTKKERQRC